jgi:dimethylglycine dehydrogenase
MKSHARVAIVGGGINGCSLLYHLTKLGWRDVVLIERDELTSGSTWHAAGNTPHFDGSMAMSQLYRASTEIYARLEAETGQATGFQRVGSIRIAKDRDRVDQFKKVVGQSKNIGQRVELIGPNEIKALFPFVELSDVILGAYTPEDGYTDPASTTNALAKGARDGGAEIYRKTTVTGMEQRPDGSWLVRTDKGDIAAEIVVNAAGTWARDLGKKVGLDLPIVNMEHQYLVTEAIPAVKEWGKPFPLLRDPYASFYLRPEGQGMLFGPYEQGGKPWAVGGVPANFGADLLPPDLERLETCIEAAMARVPVLKTAGIKRVVNGPIPHTPDDGPLIGPAPGLRNHWLLCGFSVGIGQGGGAGKALAEWIVEGEPSMEMFEMDPRRFGSYATLDYTVAKAVECYAKMYAIFYPREERPAGRPSKTTPIYYRLKEQNAVFEARFGWERAAWFAPTGTSPTDVLSFRRSNWFGPVGEEVKAVRERVGVLDLSGFSKYEVSGPGAEAYLGRLCANRPPKKVGGLGLTQMLTPKGKVWCEGTVVRQGPERFYVVTASVAQIHDRDWFEQHLPKEGVKLDDITTRHGVLVLAGPRSREVLRKLTHADLSNAAFPWLTGQEIIVAGVPVWALRVNYVGELGWELHHRLENQVAIYEGLMAAGAEFGIANFGSRAMDAMRLEKGYRAWGNELLVETNPFEAGLDRLVKFDAGRDFIGRAALEEAKGKPLKWRCRLLTVAADDVDAPANAPVFVGDKHVGVVSSGGYGYAVKSSLALAFLRPPHDALGTKVEIEILGDRRQAVVVDEPLYDQDNARLKA